MSKVFLLVIMTLVSGIASANTQSCAQKYAAYVDSQLGWQHDSTVLVIQGLPEYREIAEHYRDVQLAAIKMRHIAVQLTLQYFPEKVDINGNTNQWIDLSPELKSLLSERDINFKQALEQYHQIQHSGSSLNGNEFRKAFRQHILPSSAFKRRLSAFNLKVKEVNAAKCQVAKPLDQRSPI